MDISIEQIKCLVAFKEAGSYTKASDSLGKAKSAVIYSIKTLQEQLGVDLFEKKGRASILNERGEQFYILAKKLLGQYDEFKDACIELGNNIETQVKISITDIYPMNRIYPIIQRAMDKFPQTEIVIEREILSGQQMLLKSMVDIAIYEKISESKLLKIQNLNKVQLKLVMAKSHVFNQLPPDEKNFESLDKFPHIIQRSTLISDEHSQGVNKQSLKWRVNDIHSKKEMIINSLGWGRLPEYMIKEELKANKLTHLKELDQDMEANILIGHLKSKKLGKVASFIWSEILDSLNDL